MGTDALTEESSQQPVNVPGPQTTPPPSPWGRMVARYGLVAGLVALVALFGALEPDAFFTIENLKSTVTIGTPLLVLAVGLTVPLSMGEFDLSISASTQLWAVLLITFISVNGISWGLSFGLVLALGALAGALIGLAIVWSGVNAFIVTLGVGTVMAGLEFAVAQGTTLYEGIPLSFTRLGIGEVLGIPVAGIIAAAFCLAVWLVTERTVLGRQMRAVGGNAEAARLCGVRVDLLRVLGFVATGIAAVLAAMLITAQASSYYPNAATAMLLPAYAACFLGTTVFRSNIFDVAGTVVGVVFLAVVQNGLLVLGVPTWTAQVAQGGVLVVAVMASKLASGGRR